MDDFVLDIQHLTVDLPRGADRAHAITDCSLQLRPDEVLCIVGESGSGKSMTARAVMGLLPAPHVRASGGHILFKGEDLLKASPARMRNIRGKDIAMIFQEPMTALNPVMTIGAQIGEVLKIHVGMKSADCAAQAIELLSAVNLPDPKRAVRAYPHQLSGGQRQRVMIAMALALNPAVLIADEPTTALDVTTQAQILRLIKDIQAKHRTGILFITHDFGVVADIADRVAVMQFGKIVECGTVRQVLGAPQHPYTCSLIAAIPDLAPRPSSLKSDAPVLLAVAGLQKDYRRSAGMFRKAEAVHAARNVSFTVRRGETLGIVGESGSGKSTVARCLTRLIKADEGSVKIDGVDVQALSRRTMRSFSKRIQMVFQDPYGSLNPRRTVGQLIAEGPMIHGMKRAQAVARAGELLEMVGLDRNAAGRYPHEFSGGQRQRIGLARALALDPEILVADEPVSALDVSVQAQVLKLLAQSRDRMNLTMVFVTHDLRVASQVCDNIIVMRRGEIVEHGSVGNIFAHPEHPYTRELVAAIPGRAWLMSGVREQPKDAPEIAD